MLQHESRQLWNAGSLSVKILFSGYQTRNPDSRGSQGIFAGAFLNAPGRDERAERPFHARRRIALLRGRLFAERRGRLYRAFTPDH